MSSVRVSKADSFNTPPRGLPFYVKTGVCKQQTDWLEPQYVFTYQVKSLTGSYGPITKVLSRSEYISSAVQQFIATPSPDTSAWNKTIFGLPGPRTINEADPRQVSEVQNAGDWSLVTNTAAIEAAVDYGTVFYLNSARPLAGNTQVDAKLAADGTLTEGSVQLQDQTLSTFTGAVSSLVASANTAAKSIGLVASESKLAVSTKIYKHSHLIYTGNLQTPARVGSCQVPAAGVFGGSYSVAEVSEPSAATGAKPGSDDSSIRVSGTIVLPKPSPTPGKP